MNNTQFQKFLSNPTPVLSKHNSKGFGFVFLHVNNENIFLHLFYVFEELCEGFPFHS